jgi:serine/threonine protein kinase
MKMLDKVRLLENEDSLKQAFNERNFLRYLHHPYLVNAYWSFQDEYNLYIVMDICRGGDLRFSLNHDKIPINEESAKFYIASMVHVLEYIHGKKVLHRDIKPENIVLDSVGYIKLTDFGISSVLDEDGRVIRFV